MPFEGKIVDGFIWGRGTPDIKNQLIGIMEAAETLLQQGYRPERTILFGLGHDEETGGVNGCKIRPGAQEARTSTWPALWTRAAGSWPVWLLGYAGQWRL